MSDNSFRYRSETVELVAAAVALIQRIRAARPETQRLPGTFTVSMHSGAGEMRVGLELADGRAILIETIDADPQSAAFGTSTLGIVSPTGGEPVPIH